LPKAKWIVNNAHNAFVNGNYLENKFAMRWMLPFGLTMMIELITKKNCNATDAYFWLDNDDRADCKKNES
jgi:hypothetical protein